MRRILGILGILVFHSMAICFASNRSDITYPPYYYFAVHPETAQAINAKLFKDGYRGENVLPGLYFQDQLSLTTQRSSTEVASLYRAVVTIENGVIKAEIKDSSAPQTAVPGLTILRGVGSFEIGFVPSEIGQAGAQPWAMVHSGRLKFQLHSSRRIWDHYPHPRIFQPIQGGSLVSGGTNKPTLWFIPNDGRNPVDLGVEPVSQATVSNFSSEAFYFVGVSPRTGYLNLYLGSQSGEVVSLEEYSWPVEKLASSILVVSEGFYVLDSGKLAFWKYDPASRQPRKVFERQENANKKFVIFAGTLVARNRDAFGQDVSYYVSPNGQEIPARGQQNRARIERDDNKVFNELHAIQHVEKSARGDYFDVLPRPKYLNAILGNLIYGSTGWINIVGKDGVNTNDLIKDLSNLIAWQENALPRDWQQLAVVSITLEQLKQTYEAGIAIDSAKAQGKISANTKNPWQEFIKGLTQKQVILALPDFLSLQGTLSGQEQLAFLLQAFNSRINARDVGDLESRKILILTVTTEKDWKQAVSTQPTLSGLAQSITVQPPVGEELKAILNSRIARLESRTNTQMEESLLPKVIEYSANFYPTLEEPGRSTQLIEDLAAYWRTRRELGDSLQVIPLELSHFSRFALEQHGIQLTLPGRDEVLNALDLELVGQDLPKEKLANAISRIRSGLFAQDRGFGSYLLMGPRGVGKSFTSDILQKTLAFPVVYINLAANPNTLIPPQKVQELLSMAERPHIVHFDELDKADPDVIKALHPILEKGEIVLDDGQNGTTLSFRKALVILTANYGERVIEDTYRQIGAPTEDNEFEYIQALENTSVGLVRDDSESLQKGQIPKFIWVRLVENLCVFTPFTEAQGIEIVRRQLKALEMTLAQGVSHPFKIRLSVDLAKQIARRSIEQKRHGHGIRQELEVRVTNKIVAYLSQFTPTRLKDLEEVIIVSSPSGRWMMVSNLDDLEKTNQVDRSHLLPR